MTLHEKLLEFGNRLNESGKNEDAAIVYSAALQLAPLPVPTMETLTQPVPGLYRHFKAYL